MKKILSGILALCLSLALLSACDRGGQPDKTVTAGGLTFAKSYSEVYSALTDAQKAIAERNTLLNTGADSSEPNGAGAAGEGSEGTFYSGTNVQVEGVDEGDIVKTDGKYIYILRGSEMVVMQADGKDVTDVSNVFVGQDWEQTTTEDGLAHTQEKLPTELYLSGSRAVVVSAYSDWTDLRRDRPDRADACQVVRAGWLQDRLAHDRWRALPVLVVLSCEPRKGR